MAECDDGPLAVSQVVHKTAIELTEAGTKAAAVTQVIMRPESEPFGPPEEVYLDRPFFYMIIDHKSKLPIFMGAVTDLPDAEAVGNVASVEPIYSICKESRWLEDEYLDSALGEFIINPEEVKADIMLSLLNFLTPSLNILTPKTALRVGRRRIIHLITAMLILLFSALMNPSWLTNGQSKTLIQAIKHGNSAVIIFRFIMQAPTLPMTMLIR